MRGAVLNTCPGDLAIEEIGLTEIGAHEVLIRTSAAGLCHSDLHYITGDHTEVTPVVMGHESAGVVEAVGERVVAVGSGDHVVTCVSSFCGRCEYCLIGKPYICRFSRDTRRADRIVGPSGTPIAQFVGLGSFAEQMLVHENTCVKIRDEMPLDVAAVIGCAVITGVGAVWNAAAVRPGDTVVVIGCGGVGLNIVQGAFIAGAGRIIAIDINDRKLDAARLFGATDVIDAADGTSIDAVRDLTDGGARHVFESIGLKSAAEDALRMLRSDGCAYIVGMVPELETVDVPSDLFMSERRIQGALLGNNRFRLDMPIIVDLYLQGRLKLDELISHRVAIEEINEAFEALRRGETMRTLVTF